MHWIEAFKNYLLHGRTGHFFEDGGWYFDWFIVIFLILPLLYALVRTPFNIASSTKYASKLREQTKNGRHIACYSCGHENVIGKLFCWKKCRKFGVGIVPQGGGSLRTYCTECETEQQPACWKCAASLEKEIFEVFADDHERSPAPTPVPIQNAVSSDRTGWYWIGKAGQHLSGGPGFWTALGAASCSWASTLSLATSFGLTPPTGIVALVGVLFVTIVVILQERDDFSQAARAARLIERSLYGSFFGLFAAWIVLHAPNLLSVATTWISGEWGKASDQVGELSLGMNLIFALVAAGVGIAVALRSSLGEIKALFKPWPRPKWSVLFKMRKKERRELAIFTGATVAAVLVLMNAFPSLAHWLGSELAAAWSPALQKTYSLWWVIWTPIAWTLADQLYRSIPSFDIMKWTETRFLTIDPVAPTLPEASPRATSESEADDALRGRG